MARREASFPGSSSQGPKKRGRVETRPNELDTFDFFGVQSFSKGEKDMPTVRGESRGTEHIGAERFAHPIMVFMHPNSEPIC